MENEVDDRIAVYLGNRQAIEIVADPDPDAIAYAADNGLPTPRIRRPAEGKRCTVVRVPREMPLMEVAAGITQPQSGVWASVSDAPAPAWVASDHAQLAALLAAHWGCEVREPDPDHQPSGDAAPDPVEA